MPKENVSRERIVNAVVNALEPLGYVNALWEGGAVAFGRLDRWSDVDICVDAADDRVEDVFPVTEAALEALAPIELKLDVPPASTHGYVQAFYRLQGASRFLLVDLAVFKHSEPNKLLEPEIHGNSKFHFNKQGAVRIPSLDRAAFVNRMKAGVKRLLLRFDTFACFVDKEINRGNWIEAMDLYHRVILGSLMQVLRMRHHPIHYDFGTRYIHYELTPDVVRKLVDLHFVADRNDLSAKVKDAERWFRRTMGEIDVDRLVQQL
jgi:predicted nucleotidyltransferase